MSKLRRKRRSSSSTLWIPIAVVAILGALAAWQFWPSGNAAAATGAPSGNLEKVVTAPGLDEQIIDYKGMTVSFNPSLHIPNWTAWELTADETRGDVKRSDKFVADTRVAGCPASSDYSRSGYDRGHMAPAGDMKWDPEAMAETFYLTNICPQDHSLNSRAWKKLEEKCRDWARIDSAIIIVCGPVLSQPPVDYIGKSRVAVPAAFFKVILSPHANPPRGIGFIMPNSYVKGGMQTCAVSIDEVERVTGHDFFSELPDDIENDVESRCQFHFWSTLQ